MTTPINSNNERIDLVDGLRGFALMGILLLHHIEHFNLLMRPPEPWGPFSPDTDRTVFQGMFFLFGGKAYAIFAMMFGLTFWKQFSRKLNEGKDFTLRFMWRMLILFGFGQFHSLFYSGDIVAFYAVMSLILILTWRLPDWIMLIIGIILLLQPFELIRLIYHLENPEAPPATTFRGLWRPLIQAYQEGSFWEVLALNYTQGQKASILWTWDHGRFFQTPGLFLIGFLAAKKDLFTSGKVKLWFGILLVSLAVWIPFYFLRENLNTWTVQGQFRMQMRLLTEAYRNLSQTFVWVSLFVLLWKLKYVQTVLRWLCPFGRMSLTNYILLGIIGTLIYQNHGLGMYRHMGSTISLFIGIVFLALHVGFSTLWLKKFRYGPCEWFWRKLTNWTPFKTT